MMLDDVATYIAANSTLFSVGGTTGSLSKAQMLDTQPDTICTLFEQPGLPVAYAFSTGTQTGRIYDQPSLQVLSRSTSPTVAQQRADAIYDMLDGLTNTTMSGTRYLEFAAVQAPFQAGRDDNERWLWSVNFDVKREL